MSSMWKALALCGVASALTMVYVMTNHECIHDIRESFDKMKGKAGKTIKNMME